MQNELKFPVESIPNTEINFYIDLYFDILFILIIFGFLTFPCLIPPF